MTTLTTIPESKIVKNQTKIVTVLNKSLYGQKVDAVIKIRHDDNCNNGHNSFSVTAIIYEAGYRSERRTITAGCCHEAIKRIAPELEYLIKWHLCSTDEPVHYVSNTMYHANETDCLGLRKGEYSTFKKKVFVDIGQKSKVYQTNGIYNNKQNNPNLDKCNVKEEKKLSEFIAKLNIPYSIEKVNEEWSKSEGKEIDLAAARSCAIAPKATLKQLQDKEWLVARLPKLMQDFKKDVESLGFTY